MGDAGAGRLVRQLLTESVSLALHTDPPFLGGGSANRRFYVLLLSSFAAIALVMAIAGIYG